jgi:N-acyl homoserine lactone hydrolase
MPIYSIWVLEYSYIPDSPLSALIYGAHNQGTRKLPYCYVLIRGRDTVAMIDVGHNDAGWGSSFAKTLNVQGWKAPSEVLAQCGVTPEQVTHVFLTHAHYDHMGNIAAFPITKWVWSMALPPKFRFLNLGVDPGDILKVVDLAQRNRLICLTGDHDDILPGIDCRLASDTHTWGSMYIVVRNDGTHESDDTWVFAGDLVYTYENLRGRNEAEAPQYIPVGLAVGSQANLIFTTDAMVKAAGGDPNRVIPIHEARLPTAFPSKVLGLGLTVTELALAKDQRSIVA